MFFPFFPHVSCFTLPAFLLFLPILVVCPTLISPTCAFFSFFYLFWSPLYIVLCSSVFVSLLLYLVPLFKPFVSVVFIILPACFWTLDTSPVSSDSGYFAFSLSDLFAWLDSSLVLLINLLTKHLCHECLHVLHHLLHKCHCLLHQLLAAAPGSQRRTAGQTVFIWLTESKTLL